MIPLLFSLNKYGLIDYLAALVIAVWLATRLLPRYALVLAVAGFMLIGFFVHLN